VIVAGVIVAGAVHSGCTFAAIVYDEDQEHGTGEPPMATDTEQTTASETTKPIHLDLALSDFTVFDTISGAFHRGIRHIPDEFRATAFITAKWKQKGRDKLLLNGHEIEPDFVPIQFSPVKDREGTENSRADHNALVVNLLEDSFAALRRAVEREDIARATFFATAEPHPLSDDMLRLNFGNLSIEHRRKVEPGPVIPWLRDWRTEHYLIAILIVLSLILFHLPVR
jgi:hypothetical protein